MSEWHFEMTSPEGGVLHYRGATPFSASWATSDGPDVLASTEGWCWSDDGAEGEEDTIYFYNITWQGQPPPQARFDELMKASVRELDRWIAEHL